MDCDSDSFNLWSSRQRSVPEVSLINGLSSELSSNKSNFDEIPNRRIFPISSSPPLRDYTSNNSKSISSDLTALKNDLILTLKQEKKTEIDHLKLDLITLLKDEQTFSYKDLKLQMERNKNDMVNMLEKQEESLCNFIDKLIFKVKLEMLDAVKTLKVEPRKETAEQMVQVSPLKLDVSVQTDDDLENGEVNTQRISSRIDCQQSPKSPTSSPKQNVNEPPRYGRTSRDEEEYEHEQNRRFPPEENRRRWMSPLEQPPMNGWRKEPPLRKQVVLKNHPVGPMPCTDVTLAADAMCAKYLPQEAIPTYPAAATAARSDPRTPPTKDVVFNMTNVSLAMRCPTDRKEPEMYAWHCNPAPRQAVRPAQCPPAAAERDEEYYWQFDQMRNCLADYWPQQNNRRPDEPYWRRPDWPQQIQDEYRRRNPRRMDDGRRVYEDYYEEEFNNQGFEPVNGEECGRRQQYDVNEAPIVRGRSDGRRPPPCADRILDVSAIMNQPKLQ